MCSLSDANGKQTSNATDSVRAPLVPPDSAEEAAPTLLGKLMIAPSTPFRNLAVPPIHPVTHFLGISWGENILYKTPMRPEDNQGYLVDPPWHIILGYRTKLFLGSIFPLPYDNTSGSFTSLNPVIYQKIPLLFLLSCEAEQLQIPPTSTLLKVYLPELLP